MIDETRELIFASVTSSLVAAVAHGVLGGFAFGLTGIRAPIFWGVMMGFFSLVPVVGSALIWVPAAISLMVDGHMGMGIALMIFCSVIVGLVDNIIRPWMISGRAEMGGLVVFISVLGGSVCSECSEWCLGRSSWRLEPACWISTRRVRLLETRNPKRVGTNWTAC